MRELERPVAAVTARTFCKVSQIFMAGCLFLSGATAAFGCGYRPDAALAGGAGERRDIVASMEQEADAKPARADSGQLTVRGSRLPAQGSGVECPRILGDDGRIYSVSYFSPAIAPGDRVEVTGHTVNMTTCLGKIICADRVVPLNGQ